MTTDRMQNVLNVETSFNRFLKDEFLKKVRINKRFSLRSYARFLNIHFATLSQLMSGKRSVTSKTIRSIGPRLHATEEMIETWIAELKKQNQEPEVTTGFQEDIDYKILEQESLTMLSEWYHDAIVELVYTKNFKRDVTWIARCFNISYIEADQAIGRLFKLRLLTTDYEGNWVVTDNFKTTLTSEVNTSKALRIYQKDLLQKSIESIEIVPIEKRTHTSLMVAISEEQLTEIREEIRMFRRKLNQLVVSKNVTTQAESVYCFCFSGFPVSTNIYASDAGP